MIERCLGYLGFPALVSFVHRNGRTDVRAHPTHTTCTRSTRATSKTGVGALLSMTTETVGVWSMLSPPFFIFSAFRTLGCVVRTIRRPATRWDGRGSRGRAFAASRHMTHRTQLLSVMLSGRQRRHVDGRHCARSSWRLAWCFRVEARLQDFGACLGFHAPKSF